jgi:hypothetical protein
MRLLLVHPLSSLREDPASLLTHIGENTLADSRAQGLRVFQRCFKKLECYHCSKIIGICLSIVKELAILGHLHYIGEPNLYPFSADCGSLHLNKMRMIWRA